MDGASSSSRSSNTNTIELNLVDDFYFSALCDDQEVFPISDEKYALELQLQEALMSSAISSRNPTSTDDVGVETSFKILKGESSGSGTFCMICLDVKPSEEMFTIIGCNHSFCTDCIGRYVGTKIQENISNVKCPDVKCKGLLEPQSCREFIPQQVFDRWENALCESMVLGSQKFYCPFKDCSAMLVDNGEEVVTVSECSNCRRLFCAQCQVAWHSGVDCSEFQMLSQDERGREDIMVMELAKQNQWRRCPKCKFYVERTEGCLHITCRFTIKRFSLACCKRGTRVVWVS